VSELYIGDEFSAFGNDLLSESGSKTRFRSKDASDQNIYTRSGALWTVITTEGKTLIFGTHTSARIADSESGQKIYAWMLESEEDLF